MRMSRGALIGVHGEGAGGAGVCTVKVQARCRGVHGEGAGEVQGCAR